MLSKKMIFHHPLPLEENANTASRIRPVEMKKAFQSLGYEVALVTGYSGERKHQSRRVENQIKAGTRFDFLYSESSTMPTLMTDPNHWPVSSKIDFGLWETCKKANISIGVFYRDVYWMFPEYRQSLSWFRRKIATYYYQFDLKQYRRLASRVYLPSFLMQQYVPIVPPNIFDVLPPGHDQFSIPDTPQSEIDQIRLLYVGGIGVHYRMHELVKCVSSLAKVELTICCRKNEWESVKSQYSPLSNNIQIVHESDAKLNQRLEKTDIALMYFEPTEYRQMAAPVKLFKYIGSRRPIIATSGNLAADFIEDHQIGWVIPYDSQELRKLLLHLLNHRDEIRERREHIEAIADQHSWLTRAKKVANDLA